MANSRKPGDVMKDRLAEALRLIDEFWKTHDEPEAAALCRKAAEKFATLRNSPFKTGQLAGWASGLVRGIVYVNFLDDPDRGKKKILAAQVDKHFGVSSGTGAAKAKIVREALEMAPFASEWSTGKTQEHNPFATMLQMENGMIFPASMLPRALQEQALARGLISRLPETSNEDFGNEAPAPEQKATKGDQKNARRDLQPGRSILGKAPSPESPRLYTLEVFIVGGPVTESFAEKNPEIGRTIEIRGDLTLDDLHDAIFDAFGRFDAHLYEFLFGTGPDDVHGPRIVHRALLDGSGNNVAGTTDQVTIDSLGLQKNDIFGYRFDMGDDWVHQIDVVHIADSCPKGRFPRVIKRVGANPPQYVDWDEEE